MEKFELVDKNGNRTGRIINLEELETNRNIPDSHYLPVAGIVIINENNEILLEKRSMKKVTGAGKWGICAGKVDYGETPIEAAIRETSEEIGINFNQDDLNLLCNEVIKDARFTIYYTKVNIPINKYTIQKSELDEVKYFKLDEIENLENNLFGWTNNVKKILENDYNII